MKSRFLSDACTSAALLYAQGSHDSSTVGLLLLLLLLRKSNLKDHARLGNSPASAIAKQAQPKIDSNSLRSPMLLTNAALSLDRSGRCHFSTTRVDLTAFTRSKQVTSRCPSPVSHRRHASQSTACQQTYSVACAVVSIECEPTQSVPSWALVSSPSVGVECSQDIAASTSEMRLARSLAS